MKHILILWSHVYGPNETMRWYTHSSVSQHWQMSFSHSERTCNPNIFIRP